MDLKTIKQFIYFGFFCLLFLGKNCFAQTLDSIHYSWKVFETVENLEDELDPVKRCYILSPPQNSKTSYTADRNAYLAISRFENDRTEEVNISSGYEFKIGSKIFALVGNKNFELFTKDDYAWLDSKIKDKEFIQKMLESDEVKVRSDSAIGSYAVDEYSLKGFVRAYKRMKDLCP